MLPIFNEYIKFLKDKTNNDKRLDFLQEGYYWLDNQIIKAYDHNGKLHKMLRIKVDDKLNISLKTYKKTYKGKVETWQDTYKRKQNRLKRLEQYAIKIIDIAMRKYKGYTPIVLYSGGKDSTVTNHLVQQIKKTHIIFSNTSLDCADTYKHVKKMDNTTIINPDQGFYHWIHKNLIPNRISRGCCTYFKEGSMIEKLDENSKYLFFLGMRNEESNNRSEYKVKWRNNKWGDRDWQGILPIRRWTEEDVWLYIFSKNLEFNTKYRKGYARVGCAIACPFYTKSTWVLDKYWYPIMYDRWHRILEKDFIDNHKLEEYHMCWNGGLLRPEPTEEVIQEFANYSGLDFNIAAKYFNHNCKVCNRKIKKKEDIAMNLKMLGRNTNEYFCKKHLMEFLGMNKQQWNDHIKEFRQSGCDLF